MDLKNKIDNLIKESVGDIGVVIKKLDGSFEVRMNEEIIFPSASTIKLLVMGRLMEEIKEGKRNFDDKIILTEDKKCGGDGVLKELNEGHNFTLKEIATLMIIVSDNTATNILIDLLGIENINEIAAKMNLEHTRLRRKMMDSEAVKMGKENTTTPKEMCEILQKIYDGEFIDSKYSEITLDILKRQQVGGRLTLYLPEDIVVAHKTGDLDKLEHDVGIVYHQLGEYIICVLTKNLDTNKNGREVIGKISELVYKNI